VVELAALLHDVAADAKAGVSAHVRAAPPLLEAADASPWVVDPQALLREARARPPRAGRPRYPHRRRRRSEARDVKARQRLEPSRLGEALLRAALRRRR
jgi:hypothetical protein